MIASSTIKFLGEKSLINCRLKLQARAYASLNSNEIRDLLTN